MDSRPTPSTPDGDAEVILLRPHQLERDAAQGDPAGSTEMSITELGDRSPLQALAGAYADRLSLVRGQATAEELAASAALIATLERTCLRAR